MGPLKDLNGIKLILDDQGNHLDSYTISYESFRSFRGPPFYKPVTGQERFLLFLTANWLQKYKAVVHCRYLNFQSGFDGCKQLLKLILLFFFNCIFQPLFTYGRRIQDTFPELSNNPTLQKFQNEPWQKNVDIPVQGIPTFTEF